MVYALGWGLVSVSVYGQETRYGPAGAAFLNSALGHALDFDDTHAAATLHPGAPVGAPAELKQNPKNRLRAQFSAPFVLPTALLTGAVSWDSYSDLDNPTIRALMSRGECVHDPRIKAECPANLSGTVTVHARGRTYAKTVIVALGEPTNLLGQDAILEKFAGLVQTALGDRAIRLAKCALGFASVA